MSEKTVAQVLREARALIEDPARWTTVAVARDRTGRRTVARSADASRWDASGALLRVDAPYQQRVLAHRAVNSAALAAWDRPLDYVNDAIGHDAVLQMYDRAIEIAEGREVTSTP